MSHHSRKAVLTPKGRAGWRCSSCTAVPCLPVCFPINSELHEVGLCQCVTLISLLPSAVSASVNISWMKDSKWQQVTARRRKHGLFYGVRNYADYNLFQCFLLEHRLLQLFPFLSTEPKLLICTRSKVIRPHLPWLSIFQSDPLLEFPGCGFPNGLGPCVLDCRPMMRLQIVSSSYRCPQHLP